MPTVASNAAKMVEDLMSLHLVVRPPSAKITTNAAKASACARPALSNEIPMPDSPSTMPRPRNSSSDGSPTRAPIRAAMIAAIKTTAPTKRMASISIMRTSFRTFPLAATNMRVWPVARAVRPAALREELLDHGQQAWPGESALLTTCRSRSGQPPSATILRAR